MPVSLDLERSLWERGARVIAGIDEVGRGALAGPVSVGVVALAECIEWPAGLADSKQLPPATRVRVADAVAGFGVARAVGHAEASEVDEVGIVAALRLAAMRALGAVAATGVEVDVILLDGKHDWLTEPPRDLFGDLAGAYGAATPVPFVAGVVGVPVRTVVRGDDACASIAAASVLAKVERDALMVAAHESHPEYGWDSNVGYGAAVHLEALRRIGPSPFHRVSWNLPTSADDEAARGAAPRGGA